MLTYLLQLPASFSSSQTSERDGEKGFKSMVFSFVLLDKEVFAADGTHFSVVLHP